MNPSSNWRARYPHAILALICLLLAACGKPSAEINPPKPTPDLTSQVSGAKIEFSPHNPQLASLEMVAPKQFNQAGENYTGRVTWNEDFTNRVFSPVAGQVAKVMVEIGQTVKQGDDLALMHSSDFGQAQADYRKAMGDFSQFDKALERIKFLKEHGAAAQKDVESAQADFDRGLAEKQRAEANLELLGTTKGNFNDIYHIVSPIAGVVVDKNINVGQQVRADLILANLPTAAAPLFTVTDPTRLWVQLDVPETRLGKLKTGELVELRTPAYPGRVFPGRVESVGAFLDPLTRVAHARVSVDNPDQLLKGEMYVNVEVKEAPDVQADVEVPARAVIYQDGKYYAFVQTAPRKFERRAVTLEREAGPNGSGDVVVRGLSPNQMVVAQGSLLLNDLMESDAEAAASPAPQPSPVVEVENGDQSTPRPL